MGIFARVQILVKAHTNDLLDKVVDMNSIPVLRQYGRDLEDALNKVKHEAAMAAAHVVTLNGQASALQNDIDSNTTRGKAFMSKTPPDEANARLCASRVHDAQEELKNKMAEIEQAKQDSAAMDDAKNKLTTKYQTTVSQLRTLESRDNMTRAKEQSTAALKGINDNLSSGVSIDNLSEKITARGNEADEEFNRTIADATPPPDPVRDENINNILDSFKEKQPA